MCSRRRRPARSPSATSSPTCPAPPTPARRSRASCSARCSSSRSTCSSRQIRNRAHFQEYFVQDDWRLTRPVDPQRRAALHAELSVDRGRTTRRRCSTSIPSSSNYLGQDGQPRAARQLHKLNFGPRLGIVGRVTDKTVVRTGYALVWIEMAGSPRPSPRRCSRSCRPCRSARSTTSRRRSRSRRAERRADSADADAGLGQGVFAVDCDLGSGYVQQWNASMQRELTRTSRSKWPTSARRSPVSACPTPTSIS